MPSETIDAQLAALTATLKVLARWVPQKRHDLLGACSPISLHLSVLGVKVAKGPLTADDVNPFIDRAKANIRNVVQQLDRILLFQRQDRRPVIAVSDAMEKMADAMRTMFRSVACEPFEEAAALGTDSEYDLTMSVSAALMALYDHHGSNMALNIAVQHIQDRLSYTFSVTPAVDEGWVASHKDVPAAQRIAIDEARCLAEQLGFVFNTKENGITLRRA